MAETDTAVALLLAALSAATAERERAERAASNVTSETFRYYLAEAENGLCRIPRRVADDMWFSYMRIVAAREAAEAEAARLREALAWKPTHRHVKRGTEYMLDGYGEIQTDTPLGDYAKVAIYRAQDGTTWVRPVSEFNDGRFAALGGDHG